MIDPIEVLVPVALGTFPAYRPSHKARYRRCQVYQDVGRVYLHECYRQKWRWRLMPMNSDIHRVALALALQEAA